MSRTVPELLAELAALKAEAENQTPMMGRDVNRLVLALAELLPQLVDQIAADNPPA